MSMWTAATIDGPVFNRRNQIIKPPKCPTFAVQPIHCNHDVANRYYLFQELLLTGILDKCTI